MSTNSSHSVREMQATDMEMVFHWRNHESIRPYMFKTAKIDFSQHKQWFLQASADKSRHLLIFEDNAKPMGFIHLHRINDGDVMDWGFYKNPEGPKGTGPRLGKAALDYAFIQAGAHKICGQVIATNAASIIFHTRLGFVREGELRQQHFDGLTLRNVIYFGLLKEEWSRHAEKP